MTALSRLAPLFVAARGSDVLFHWTTLHAAESILNEGKFRLLTDKGTKTEREFAAHSNMGYYLSTTRSKVGGYHVGHKTMPQVMFNLNGAALAARRDTRVRPLEYWNEPTKKQTWLVMREDGHDSGAYPEMEDRVFCRKPTLPADRTTVDSMHVLIPELAKVYKPFFDRNAPDEFKVAQDNVKWSRLAFKLIAQAKKKGIKAFFYTDHNAWLTQNRLKRVPVLTMKKYFDQAPGPREVGEYERLVAREGKLGGRGRDLIVFRELLNKKKKSELSSRAASVLKRILRAWNPAEAAQSIDSDIHNARKDAHDIMARLDADFKKFGIKSVLEFVVYVQKKWGSVEAAVARVEARDGPKEFRHAYDDDDERRQDRESFGRYADRKDMWSPVIKKWPLTVTELRALERQIFQQPDWLRFWAQFDWTSWQRPMVHRYFDKQAMQFVFYDVPSIWHDFRPPFKGDTRPPAQKTGPDRSRLVLDLSGNVVSDHSEYAKFSAFMPTAVDVCRAYVRDRAPFVKANMAYLDKSVYIRYGEWREDERSKNFLESKRAGRDVWENGVSCYHADLDIDNGHWEIDLSINEDTISGTLDSLFHSNKPIFLVTGTEIGEGSDGEPLLKNVRLLKKLNKSEVKVSGVFDDDD